MEWLDYMYSAEGQMLLNMGIEGTHYTMQDGEPIFTDYILNNPDGLSPKQAVGTFTIAQGTMPSVLCFSETSQLDDAAVLEAKENCIIPFLEESNKYVIPGTLSFSSEKDAERRAAMADIETYVDEMVMKFITGREPIGKLGYLCGKSEGKWALRTSLASTRKPWTPGTAETEPGSPPRA